MAGSGFSEYGSIQNIVNKYVAVDKYFSLVQDATENNTTITTWADKSGNSYDAISSTTTKSKFVAGVYQTKGCLSFNGTQSLPIQYAVESPYALNTGEPLTIFLVMYSTSSSAYLISGPQDGILNIGVFVVAVIVFPVPGTRIGCE